VLLAGIFHHGKDDPCDEKYWKDCKDCKDKCKKDDKKDDKKDEKVVIVDTKVS
jgi:hypothetical protein